MLIYDILMLLYQLSELYYVNVNPYNTPFFIGFYIFTYNLKRLEDLFLFYMIMNILLLFKIVYSIKFIINKFDKYSNTNRVITNMCYGGLIFFNLAFSIVMATGITDDTYVQIPTSYAGFAFTICLAVVNIYLIFCAYYLNQKVRND